MIDSIVFDDVWRRLIIPDQWHQYLFTYHYMLDPITRYLIVITDGFLLYSNSLFIIYFRKYVTVKYYENIIKKSFYSSVEIIKN